MRIKLIYATDPNGIIGYIKDGKFTQPFHSKKDFNWFKSITEDSVVIMGNNTYKAIGKPLPNRFNIVITSNPEQYAETPNMIAVSSIKQAICQALLTDFTEMYFIGGANILEQVSALADVVYITKYSQYVEYNDVDADKYIQYIPPERYDLKLISEESFVDTDLKTGEHISGEFQIYSSLYKTNITV